MTVAPPPTLPATAARLLALCAEEEYSVSQLVRVIEADPAVASRLLRLANSAYFGVSRQVESLNRAVDLLGRMTVQALVLGHSLLGFWKGRAVPPAVEGLWTHAYLCALGCRHLAQRLSRAPHLSAPETLFLTGLLHDIGKILFLVQTPNDYSVALDVLGDRESLLTWERDRFGDDHAEAGGSALEQWQLPFSIAAVVRYHHRQGLRAELQADWQVLRAVDGLAAGEEPGLLDTSLPGGLLADLAGRMGKFGEEAREFYQVLQ
ncbi:MAG: HDOD domain-containing protein [Deltaproteobacteria bacterium]|nr:HDOD domain-containing protein [Deltaproteobacteria bacterium]